MNAYRNGSNMQSQRRFMVLDTAPDMSWQRVAISNAATPKAALTDYVDACVRAGVTPGVVHVFRSRNLAAAA